jgi:hypothetical protein
MFSPGPACQEIFWHRSRPLVSIGTETGPPIGMQKGPLFERRCKLVQVANRRDPRVTWSALTSGGTARAGGSLFAHLGKLRGSVSRGS